MSNDKDKLDLSAEQHSLIEHESFIAEVLRLRNPAGNRERSGFTRFIESSAGAASITVLVGGIFGSWITGQIQDGAKEREFQQAWLKARGDQALQAHKDYLEKQRETVSQIFDQVGASLSSSEDLLLLARADMTAKAGTSREETKIINEKRNKITETYEAADTTWRNKKDSFGMLLGYYFPSRPSNSILDHSSQSTEHQCILCLSKDNNSETQTSLDTTWTAILREMARFKRCAKNWAESDRTRSLSEIERACTEERKALGLAISAFNNQLEIGRRYAWEGWESPERLKSMLKISRKTN